MRRTWQQGTIATLLPPVCFPPDYSFATAPAIDILLLPSMETSLTADLENTAFMTWLKTAVSHARYVITLCDGAFPLAATGALEGRTATTFPGDRKELAKRFPDFIANHED